MKIRFLLFALSSVAICALSVTRARAGFGTELAAAGCGSAVDSLVLTQVAVDPHVLTFSSVVGEEPPPSQSIAVQCYDPSYAFDTSCGGSVRSDQPWLLLDRDGFDGVDSVEVAVAPEGLEPGIYEGKIRVRYDFVAIDDSEDVTVELIVRTNEE